jgi:hypothetical protein
MIPLSQSLHWFRPTYSHIWRLLRKKQENKRGIKKIAWSASKVEFLAENYDDGQAAYANAYKSLDRKS